MNVQHTCFLIGVQFQHVLLGFSSMIQPGIACPDMSYISLFSSMFMHGGLMHLGGNMLFLWIFGDNIELKFGKAKFLLIYLGWGVGAGLAHIVLDPTSTIPAVGASGAISGVLGAYLAIYPQSPNHNFSHARIFLENDAHSGSMVLTFLASLPKLVAFLHRRFWSCRWWSCIHGSYWRFCNRICNRLSVQEIS